MNDTVRPFTAAAYNQYLKEHQLMGTRCLHCGAVHLPPRPICPACRAANSEWVALSGRARLAAFSSIFIGPSAMNALGYSKANPYVSGVVELEEGPKVSARILGLDAAHPDTIQIGTPLSVEYLQEGENPQPVLAFRVV